MSGHQHREARSHAGHDHADHDPAHGALEEPHLAPGGGNSYQLGAIGTANMDDGVRALDSGESTYGRDPFEGGLFSGIFDYIDRQVAQVQLRNRFEIVDDQASARTSNQVTREQFERIATMYSDIRRGNTNLEIATGDMDEAEAAEFRGGTMDDIADMLTTEQGRGLLDDLAYQQVDGRDLTTRIGRAANAGQAAAYVGPNMRHPSDATNGTGVEGGVNYVPGHVTDMATDLGNPNYETSPWRHMTSDVVLFHELVHRNRSRQGLSEGEFDASTGTFDQPTIEDADARSSYDRGAPIEEYATVGIGDYADTYNENAYRRERAAVTGQVIPQRDTYNGSGPARRR